MSDLKFYESTIRMPLVNITARSTLVPLKNNKYVLISPVKFDEGQRSELLKVNPEAIVSPSCFHHLFIKAAHDYLPEAKLYGAPGLQRKRADIKWDGILNETPWPYQDELKAIVIEGAPKINEVVFYHRDSKTLIVTDLLFNLKNLKSLPEKLVYGLMGTFNNPAVSRLVKLMTRDRKALKKSLKQVLELDFDRLVMAHGEIIPTGGKKIITDALNARNLL